MLSMRQQSRLGRTNRVLGRTVLRVRTRASAFPATVLTPTGYGTRRPQRVRWRRTDRHL